MPGSGDLGRVMVDLFDSYSAEDQKIIFNHVISPTNMSGNRRYADVASWKANVAARATLLDYMKRAETDSSLQSDSKYAEAEALWKVNDSSGEAWTAMVLKLFGVTPDYKIDLSEDARRIIGELPSARSSGAAAYEPGAVASKRI